jgi:isoleucyl-tRNA synthetase
VASAGAVNIALDTAVTPELAREGLARELVSVLQQARKSAGLDVSDRITVMWASDDAEVAIALAAHAAFIAGEVLATTFTEGASTHATAADLNGKPISYAIAKA